AEPEQAEEKEETPVKKGKVDSAGRVIKEDDAAQSDDSADEYVPDGFNPYGVYLLVYDSGFEVKTRYSQSGLTYYKESEEFFFVLDKDLPNFPGKVAHILFNMAAPMDPSEAAGEVFPYDEHYMIYITLDDGSYYEVSRDQLDLKGRVFIRDLYESFREKWEGAF
ncbi:MAG: hypothetical protein Q4F43_05805, partial [Eubacteriales bacterium]|nr:hypothetical protein [Eubacteriales bacterium]